MVPVAKAVAVVELQQLLPTGIGGLTGAIFSNHITLQLTYPELTIFNVNRKMRAQLLTALVAGECQSSPAYSISCTICSYFPNLKFLNVVPKTLHSFRGLRHYNTILNCDSFYNADARLENADGFAVKMDAGTGNKFTGCRVWNNLDDGWDGYLRESDSITTIYETAGPLKWIPERRNKGRGRRKRL